jgi:type II secretory pathway pseudopilin PulG
MISALLMFLISILTGLTFNNIQGAQSKAQDTVAKNDINSIYQKLEEHYNEYGYYPLEQELVNSGSSILAGIDPEALIDKNGNKLNEGIYSYKPEECSIVGCAHYTLSSQLNNDEMYTKTSLN